MNLIKCRPSSGWAYVARLNAKEWPRPLANNDSWLQSPIYQWQYDANGACAFTWYGDVLFELEEDAIQFYLTWNDETNN